MTVEPFAIGEGASAVHVAEDSLFLIAGPCVIEASQLPLGALTTPGSLNRSGKPAWASALIPTDITKPSVNKHRMGLMTDSSDSMKIRKHLERDGSYHQV